MPPCRRRHYATRYALAITRLLRYEVATGMLRYAVTKTCCLRYADIAAEMLLLLRWLSCALLHDIL